uniref:Uncharacterized protein n=1 Tax=Ciona intestinalis TaxID=7719 RepID=H2Y3P3_CIOIN
MQQHNNNFNLIYYFCVKFKDFNKKHIFFIVS